jgi:hypothetical protein
MSEIDSKKDKLQIHGIRKISVSAKEFVELPIILLFNDGEKIRFQIEIYVVDRFFIDILLENNFFRSNDINILILLLINGLPALQMREYFIIFEELHRPIDLLKTFRKRTVIKTVEIFMIIVGMG